MPDYRAAEMGVGLKSLLQEEKSSLSSSTQIFANAPVGTRKILMTVDTQSVRLRFDAGTPTATRGALFATGTYELDIAYGEALKVRCIEVAASASLDIEYFGRT